jgi:hypothetical protein
MVGVALALLAIALSGEPVEVVCDNGDIQMDQGVDGQVILESTEQVSTIHTRRFNLPFVIAMDVQDQIENLKLFVSVDGGKSWKIEKNCKPTDKCVLFEAPNDGVYWFVLQVVYKNGKCEPEIVDRRARYVRKVYVDSEHKVLKPR